MRGIEEIVAEIRSRHPSVAGGEVLDARGTIRPTERGARVLADLAFELAEAVGKPKVEITNSSDLFESPARIGRPDRVPGSYGPAFSANFESLCNADDCGDEIEPGDSIRMGDEGAVHATCAERAGEPASGWVP